METTRSGGTHPVVYAASCVTVALGLAFIFVRAPHPWGWEGIDHYHDLGLSLARGEMFPTTDVPWGYAYFLAFFYRLAGARPWVPLTVQALLNGLVPIFAYHLARRDLGERVAIVAAALTGVLSFNTVYASTESSDALCTVSVLGSLVLFAQGLRTGRFRAFVGSGIVAGIAPQLRPNLILLPGILAVIAFLLDQRHRRLWPSLLVYAGIAAAASLPWTIRNYQLTGEFIPTSTHGAMQLWYGSLETGPYLKSRAYNPRSAFEVASFDYTSLANRPLIVTADSVSCAPARGGLVELVYWTDRNTSPVHVPATHRGSEQETACGFIIPGQPLQTTVYYFFSSEAPNGGGQTTPRGGAADPLVYFIDDRHLVDLDRHGDLLDTFDFLRAIRAVAWNEPLPDAERLDFDHDGRISEHDVRLMAAALTPAGGADGILGAEAMSTMTVNDRHVFMTFVDGSTLDVPQSWRERITDVVPVGELAAEICAGHRRMRSLPSPRARETGADPARRVTEIRINDVFYRREPHMMRRYTALAFDNIGRDPAAFGAAALYRAARLFIVDGTSDVHTAHQFAGSRRVYAVATVASAAYLAVGVAGIVVALRRRARVWLLLTPIVYVPATICFVLINMRYSVTVQPLILIFAAVALTALHDLVRRESPAPEGTSPAATGSADTQITPRPS